MEEASSGMSDLHHLLNNNACMTGADAKSWIWALTCATCAVLRTLVRILGQLIVAHTIGIGTGLASCLRLRVHRSNQSRQFPP